MSKKGLIIFYFLAQKCPEKLKKHVKTSIFWAIVSTFVHCLNQMSVSLYVHDPRVIDVKFDILFSDKSRLNNWNGFTQIN